VDDREVTDERIHAIHWTRRPQRFVTACFLLTIAGGNLINTQFAPLYETTLSAVEFYIADVTIVLIAAVAFYFVGRRFNRTFRERE